MKRLFDLFLGLCVAAVLALPVLVVAILVRLTSRGPALYWSDRVGKGNVIFRMPKFRSMRIGTPAVATHLLGDPASHLTPVGSFLRRTSLDELPQLWSIFRGDMSFVGPRPERAYFYGEFEKYIPGFSNRLMVVPGLTGHAQVNGGYSLKPEEKIIYDMEYIEHRSVLMDVKCIIKTVSLIFTHEGAR